MKTVNLLSELLLLGVHFTCTRQQSEGNKEFTSASQKKLQSLSLCNLYKHLEFSVLPKTPHLPG